MYKFWNTVIVPEPQQNWMECKYSCCFDLLYYDEMFWRSKKTNFLCILVDSFIYIWFITICLDIFNTGTVL